MPLREGKKRGRPFLLLLIASVPVFLYFAFFLRMAVNVPFGDDYPVMGSVLDLTNPNVPEKLSILFSQFNEHRIASLRAVLLLFRAFGLAVNFKLIAFLGNLGILGLFFILWKAVRAEEAESASGAKSVGIPPVLLPVAFLLFQPQHHQLTVWAMCAFTNVLAVLFAFVSFYFLVYPRGRRAFAAAAVFAVLAGFTNGNGVFAFPIGLAVLALRKNRRRLILWAAAGVVFLGVYFFGYVVNPGPLGFGVMLKEHPAELFGYFFSALGGYADFGIFRPGLTIAVGAASAAAFAVLLMKKLHRRNPFLFASILFVFLSIGSLAASRAGLGLEQSFTSRYKFASVLTASLLALGLAACAKKRRRFFVSAALALSIVFSAVSTIVNVREAGTFRTVFIADFLKWNAGRGKLAYADPATAEMFLRDGVQRGFYRPPYDLDRLKFPFGGLFPGGEEKRDAEAAVFSGWALDDAAPPRVLVYAGALPSGENGAPGRGELMFLGLAKPMAERLPELDRRYYGFPGLDRALWEFRLQPGIVDSAAEPAALYFFAVDRFGRETLLGEREIKCKN